MIKLIEENVQENRREGLLNSFRKAVGKNSNNTINQFWQQHNKPIELWGNEVIEQKVNYIHNSPVVSGFVENCYDYLHSGVKDYSGTKGLVKIIIDW